ncbi:serine hydrolase [Bacillus sp. SCS-151]|uniref:serine hydrolase n=1 Tax=Nanhaiella sioensis TaxID=3115293 RepID=UPI00397BC35E
MKKSLFIMFISFVLVISACSAENSTKKSSELTPISSGENSELNQGMYNKIANTMSEIEEDFDFSGAVYIGMEGEEIYSNVFGMADYDQDIPNTLNTKFIMASLTKQFTAAAILLLEERGLLQLDYLVTDYFPEATQWEGITIHHLLSMSSGIVNSDHVIVIENLNSFFENVDNSSEFNNTPLPTAEDTIAIYNDIPLNFEPGEKYEYSESNYILLGLIIEQISGDEYETFLEQNIFEPLGMLNSGYSIDWDIQKNKAIGYEKVNSENDVYPIRYNYSLHHSAGGLYTSISDLAIWDRALYSEKLLKKETIDKMYGPYTEIDPSHSESGFRYSYGWFTKGNNVEHTGNAPGYVSHIYRDLDSELVIIILSNNEQYLRGDIISNVTNILSNIVKVNVEPEFLPNPVPAGSYANYHIDFEMNEDGRFFAEAEIKVENLSEDNWSDLTFYFIPNVFTAGNERYEDLLNLYGYQLEYTSDALINNVTLNEINAKYELQYDTLKVQLEEVLEPKDTTIVRIAYEFNTPKGGFRFSEEGGNYHLAQWYPMLANYESGWNKNDYFPVPESYHTTHSNYNVSFKIPQGYTIFSSSEQDLPSNTTSGEFSAENIKEMYMTILRNDMVVQTDGVDGIEIRVAVSPDRTDEIENIMETAKESVAYFDQKVGSFPHNQLDIILVNHLNMEYPGVVTISSIHSLVHEIAHQWFYGIVSNNPYDEGWLDEGLTTFATSYYYYDHIGLHENEAFAFPKKHSNRIKYNLITEPANVSVFDNTKQKLLGLYYGVAPMKIWELLKDNGMKDNATDFLKAYFETYAYSHVNTEEFVRFTQYYFKLDNTSFFEDWLEY